VKCRICNSGQFIHSESIQKYPRGNIYKESHSEASKFLKDITITICENGHLSLESSFNDTELYNSSYPYISKSKIINKRRDIIIDLFMEQVGVTTINNIVDVGCGNFELLEIFRNSKLIRKGELIGIDPVYRTEVPEQITFLNTHFAPDNINLELSNIPNLIIMDNVLEHIFEIQEFMDKLQNWLNTGDYLIVCVPSYEAMISRNQFTEISHEHCNYFDIDSVNKILSDFGFQCIESYSDVALSRVYNFHLFQKKSKRSDIELSKEAIYSNRLDKKYNFVKKFNSYRSKAKAAGITRLELNSYGVGASELTPAMAYFMENDLSLCNVIFDSTESKSYKYMPGIKPQIYPWEAIGQLPRNANLFVCAPSEASEITNRLLGLGFTNIT
jgi:hypothetical protein